MKVKKDEFEPKKFENEQENLYRKTSSRGAYGHDPFCSVFKEYPLDSTRSDSTMTLFII